MEPDILVTQGEKAREAIQQSFKISESLEDKHICSHAWIFIEGKKVLWFHTYHPRNFGKFNQQRRECFENWAEIIYETFHPNFISFGARNPPSRRTSSTNQFAARQSQPAASSSSSAAKRPPRATRSDGAPSSTMWPWSMTTTLSASLAVESL